jgi:hypothetical protein
MLDLWKTYQGRKAAVAALQPFVERSRRKFQDIPAATWLDPYLIGFMATLITLTVKRRYQPIANNALASIQSSAWAEITGIDADIIGEEICILSTSRNRPFEQGCQNGVRFFQVLFPDQRQLLMHDVDQLGDAFASVTVASAFEPAENEGLNLDADGLWTQYFEAHV